MLKRGLIIAKSIVFVFVLAVFGAFNVFAQSSSCTGFINYIPQEGDDGTETFWTYAILWDITDCQNNLICVKREDETSYKPFTGLIPTQGHITGNDNAPWIVCDKNYEFAVFPASQAQGDRCTGNPITGVPIKNVKRICIRSGIFGGQVSIVNNILIEPNPVIQGQSFTTTFQGSGLNSMWFDVKIRFASATGEGTEYQNWQQGVIGEHPADITGSFVITGVRPHQNRNDHSGQYQQVSAAFTVSSATTTSDNMFDINNDGSVNQLDYTILQRVVLGQQECPISSCDLNDDGQVNILDLQRLISQIGGGTPSNRYDINNDGSVNNQDVQALQNVVYGAQCPIQSCDLNNDGVVNILDLQILISVVNPQTDCPSSLGLCNAETSNCKQTCKVNNQDVQYYCLGIFPQGNLPPDTWKWRTENEIKSACDSIGEACSQFVYPTRCTQMAGGDPRDPLSYGGKCFKTSGENNGPAWRYATEKVCSNGQAILPSQSCPSGSTPVDCNGNPISTLGSCTNTPCNANTLCITTCTENGQEKYCRSINNMNYRWMTVAEGKAECNNQQNCGKTTRCKINSGSSPTTFTCSYRAPPANDQNNPSYGWNFYQPSELNFLYDNENCGTFCNKCTGAYCSNGACIGGEQRIPLKISGTITINGAAYPNVDVYEAYNCVGTNCVTTKIGRSNGNGAVDFEDNWVTNRVSIYAPVVQNCHKNLGGLEVECSVLAANTYSVNVKYGTSAAELRTATASANYYFLDLSKNLGSPSQCAPLGNRLLSGQQCCSGVPCNGICQTICDFGGGGSCTAQQAGNRRCNTQVNAVELCTRAGAGYAWDQVEFCGSRRCTQSGNSVACESTTNCVPLNRNAVGTCCSGQRCSDGYCRSSCGTVQCTSGQKRCNNGNIEQCVSSSVGGASIRYEWLVTQQCSSGCAVVSGNPLCSGTPYCGNNIQTSDEECDGNNFGQLTDLRCSQFSSAYTSGMLRCSNCRIDTSNCVRGSDTTSTPYTFTVKVQDYSSPRKSATKTFTINLLGGGSSGLCTTCPSGYTPGVGGCDPACRYSTPPCAMPSIPCPTIGAGTCTDTDKDATYFDGINPNTRGRATGKDQVPHDDSCISNQPNKVTEWFCNNDGTVSSLQISCDSGKLCSNGACVSSPQPTGSCGNGQLETNLGEECDGTNLGGRTCSQDGYTGGSYRCTGCSLDASGCTKVPIKYDTCSNILFSGIIGPAISAGGTCTVYSRLQCTENQADKHCDSKGNSCPSLADCPRLHCSQPSSPSYWINSDPRCGTNPRGNEAYTAYTCTYPCVINDFGGGSDFAFDKSQTPYVMNPDRPFRPTRKVTTGPPYIISDSLALTAGYARYSGRIVDESGTPVAGAKVYDNDKSPAPFDRESQIWELTVFPTDPKYVQSSCSQVNGALYYCMRSVNKPTLCSTNAQCNQYSVQSSATTASCSCQAAPAPYNTIWNSNACQGIFSLGKEPAASHFCWTQIVSFTGNPKGRLLVGQTDANGDIVFDEAFIAYLSTKRAEEAKLEVGEGGKSASVGLKWGTDSKWDIRIVKGTKSVVKTLDSQGTGNFNINAKCNFDAGTCTGASLSGGGGGGGGGSGGGSCGSVNQPCCAGNICNSGPCAGNVCQNIGTSCASQADVGKTRCNSANTGIERCGPIGRGFGWDLQGTYCTSPQKCIYNSNGPVCGTISNPGAEGIGPGSIKGCCGFEPQVWDMTGVSELKVKIKGDKIGTGMSIYLGHAGSFEITPLSSTEGEFTITRDNLGGYGSSYSGAGYVDAPDGTTDFIFFSIQLGGSNEPVCTCHDIPANTYQNQPTACRQCSYLDPNIGAYATCGTREQNTCPIDANYRGGGGTENSLGPCVCRAGSGCQQQTGPPIGQVGPATFGPCECPTPNPVPDADHTWEC